MISIIIPTLNEEKYLPILLKAIKKQSYKDYEIIVADANSKDKTVKIAKKYGCKVVKGGLPPVGRNNGAKAAKGEFLLFLDSDVFFDKDFLQSLIKQFKSKKIDAMSAFINPDSGKLIDRIFTFITNIYYFLLQKISPHASGFYIFIKRDVHRKINGFNESLKLSEDHDYVIRASKVSRFSYLYRPQLTFSSRRFEKEGRLKLALIYIYAEIYRLFKKEIKRDIVKYNFGEHK